MPGTTDLSLDTMLARARRASRPLAAADRNAALEAVAEALERHVDRILEANARDVATERERGTAASLVDRLTLDARRVAGMARGCREVADLPDPLGRVLDGWRLPNGLQVRKVSVPFGVIGMIYESRPNVTVDAAVLAIKAGSAVVLRGSSNALNSNRVLVAVMRSALASAGLPEDALQLIDSPDRALVTELLTARGRVDLVIPRGGAGLIRHVVENARVPVIETGVGNCHLYVHRTADVAAAEAIAFNAKVQRPGVCNAIETLLVDAEVAPRFLPAALARLAEAGVELVGCERTRALVDGVGEATEDDWATEYLDLKLAVRVVDGIDDALEHIARYGTQHSEAIVANDVPTAERFRQEVDAAAVYVNASTRFTDGFAMGFGAEIGISTQKLHARGPMGLAEIVTYKYLVDGAGQVRD
ncbi:MAG: glutamate-5-semialdehyde dehydrogenase [Deinococcales bacterium]|jgi:glutamate-5-semialdehyde dehydrogenase